MSMKFKDCRKITDRFRGIYGMYPNLIKENRRMSTRNWLDLPNTRISTDYAQKSPPSLVKILVIPVSPVTC
jgi:hypothetical protein